jgi:hypothetical protein
VLAQTVPHTWHAEMMGGAEFSARVAHFTDCTLQAELEVGSKMSDFPNYYKVQAPLAASVSELP